VRKYEDLIREVLLILGFIMVCYGLWSIYPPAMFVIGGAALVWVGLPPRPVPEGGDD
jgi:hypothetical protein